MLFSQRSQISVGSCYQSSALLNDTCLAIHVKQVFFPSRPEGNEPNTYVLFGVSESLAENQVRLNGSLLYQVSLFSLNRFLKHFP